MMSAARNPLSMLIGAGLGALFLALAAGCATRSPDSVDADPMSAAATPASSNSSEQIETVRAAGAPSGALAPGAELVLAARYGQGDTVRRLLDSGVDVNARDALGRTALMAVAAEGSTGLLRLLLERGADPSLRDRDGADALVNAAIKGRLDNARLLLDAGADPESRSPGGETALMAAIRAGQAEMVDFLLSRGGDPDVFTQEDIGNGYTPLMYAARFGRGAEGLNMMRQLIRHGATPGIYRPNGETALTFAERRGQRQMAEELRGLGVRDESPYAGRSEGRQLLEAIRLDDLAKVQEVLAAGADVAYRDPANGVTPLASATWYGRGEILDLLLRRGAPVNAVPHGLREERIDVSSVPLSQRELMRAVARGDTALITAIRRGDADMVRRLLEAGADLMVPNRQGDTPGLIAARLGRTAILAALIEAGLDPNVTGFDRRIPYLLTRYAGQATLVPMIVEGARHGQRETVALLLRAGARLDLADSQGWTALHAAVAEEHADLVRLLLDNDAEPAQQGAAGESPLDLARRGGNAAITALLESRADGR
jgi:ankyrin repeat protein